MAEWAGRLPSRLGGRWCQRGARDVGAVGDGATREAALADLREPLHALIAEVGIPDELTLTLEVA
jgi:hypothetical protein